MGTEPRGRGTSLWLMPEGVLREELSSLIRTLADRLGTVRFAPHVTLLAGIHGPEADVLEGARTLAADLGALPVRPMRVDALEEHFRCVFFRVGSPELRDAHDRATRRFGRDPDPAFDPHLSLVYGSLDAAARAELARELEPRLPGPFVARRLHVWRTHGPVEEWTELAALPLGAGV